jgi:hypothetical protein
VTTDAAAPTPVDLRGGASLASAAAELVAPLGTAATPEPLPWAGPARVELGVTRHPLVLVALLVDLETDAVVVTVTAVPAGGPPKPQPPVRFATYTEAGSALVAYVPDVDAAGSAGPFVLRVAAERIDATGAGSALVAAELRATVRVHLVQGVLGRVLALLLDEKQRLRRQAREITAMRALASAYGDALDRTGADLCCPRFADELVWDAERRCPGTRPLEPRGALEDDAAYRTRLGLLRGLRLPTPPWIDGALNGPGSAGTPGAGWLAQSGFTARASVDESLNPLLIAFRLVAPGSPHGRARLLDAVRRTHLVWPAGSARGDEAHDGRMVPQQVFERTAEARAALARWQLPDGQPVAPSLARALQRLDLRCEQLAARPWPALLAGQFDEGGSRLELGLGALLAPPDAAALDAAVAAATALGDPRLVPRGRDVDPAGVWLLAACGLRTAVQLADGTVFVSTAPMGPLVIDVDPTPDSPVPLTLTAHLESGVDPAHDTPMADVVTALSAEGLLPESAPREFIDAIQPAEAVPALRAVIVGLNLPAVDAVQAFAERMASFPGREYAVFDLGDARTTALIADPEVLNAVLTAAARAGASSVVPVVTAGGRLALVLAVSGLPLAGSNLAARHTLFHRWQVRGLAGEPVELGSRRGQTVQVRWPGLGISVVSCLVHLRTGGNDPYEWRAGLPDGALLSLRQYEHLLNIVELVTPVGVRADTSTIRRQHVDVDGSGRPFALPPSAARTYRHYRTDR